MNRVDIRNRARELTELTEDDVTDANIDMFARDGYERILNLERRWPFLQADATLTTTAGQQAYVLADLTVSDSTEAPVGQTLALREVVSIRDADGLRLDWIGHDEAETTWADTDTGRSSSFSVWNGKLYLWPMPATATAYTIRGYRKPVAWWDSDTLEIDADEALHVAVLYFAVSRLYQIQEDAEMASFYANTFAEATTSAHADIMRPHTYRPLVLAQGPVPGYRIFPRYTT